MKLRTTAQLDIFLDSLLAWRKKELTQLRFAVAIAGGEKQRMMLRAAVTLLYAHWEGFVKDAAQGYVQFVARQELSYLDLTDNFVALGLKRYIRSAGQSGKSSAHTELVELMTSRLGEKAHIPWQRVINTESNLRGHVFREIVVTIGVDFSPYVLKVRPVIDRLVELRNAVAHGRGLPVNEPEYAALHSEIVALLDLLRTKLSDAAAGNQFHR